MCYGRSADLDINRGPEGKVFTDIDLEIGALLIKQEKPTSIAPKLKFRFCSKVILGSKINNTGCMILC